MNKYMKKYYTWFMCMLIMIAQFSTTFIAIAETIDPIVAGDNPGVTITGPETITSQQQVELKVTLSASAGKLDEDGKIAITIPRSIVKNSSDLVNNLVIDKPFHLEDPAVTVNADGNYILNVAYDHTETNPNGTVNTTFIIKFQAPLISEENTLPNSVDFEANLTKGSEIVSTDTTTSEIKSATGGLPILSKWSPGPKKIIDGVNATLMNLANPSSNVFAISVNYNQQYITNAKIEDQIPEGTKIIDPVDYLPVTGDSTPVEHFRIARVTQRDDKGTPQAWVYETENFQNNIHLTETGFSIDFGTLTPEDSYVVMYAMEVTTNDSPSDFGVKYNHVELYTDNTALRKSDAPIALDESSYQSISLVKRVNQATLSTTQGTLEYSLSLKSLNGTIAAGTIVADPLPEYTEYVDTIEADLEYFTAANYNQESNTLYYTLLKDIPEGTEKIIKFAAIFSHPEAQAGEVITNRAYINYAGTDTYSNDVTTTLDGSAHLTKVDAETKNPLTGAEFKVIDVDTGNTILENLMTDEEGKINTGLLPAGNYQFIETKAPENYQIDITPINFTVVAGQETPIELVQMNQYILGSVLLIKKDETTQKNLAGAVFELQDKDGNKIQDNLITDENGQIKVAKLPVGSYQFVETKAPANYELDATPIPFMIEKGQTQLLELNMTNKLKTGSVLLHKLDSKSREGLKGAVFELQDVNGNVLQSSLITDHSGKIRINELKPGNYQLVETKAPLGYELDKTPIPFVIEMNQEETIELQKTNTIIPGSIILTKKDSKTNETLAGAEFELQDSEGKVLKKNLLTDETGKLVIKNLDPGNYQLVETNAPTGYEKDTEPVPFEIKKGQTETLKIEKANQVVKGSVLLTKVDSESGKTLAGAVFELQDVKGKTIKNNLVTDTFGRLAIADLKPGSYQLVETKAPSGYKIDKTPILFEVTEKMTTNTEIIKENSPEKKVVRLEKKDHDSGELLVGARFDLYDSSDQLLKKNIALDKDGILLVSDLKKGKYYFVETKAPVGYLVDATPIHFSITDENNIVSLIKYNTFNATGEKEKSEINGNHTYYPKTNSKRSDMLVILGSLMILGFLSIYFIRKKQFNFFKK